MERAVDETLANLQLSYLDLYLMHWPVAFGKLPNGKISKMPKDENGKVIIDHALTEDPSPTWRAMEALVAKGKVKHIGISNFNIRRCEQLMKNVSRCRRRGQPRTASSSHTRLGRVHELQSPTTPAAILRRDRPSCCVFA